MKLFYKSNLKTFSRKLRKSGVLSEVLLWNAIKRRKIKGYQFLRQKPIDKYIVDFYCHKLKLAIEIDGITHNEKMENDRIRQQRLESLGVSVLRFNDEDVKRNLSGVIQTIEMWIEKYENDIPL